MLCVTVRRSRLISKELSHVGIFGINMGQEKLLVWVHVALTGFNSSEEPETQVQLAIYLLRSLQTHSGDVGKKT